MAKVWATEKGSGELRNLDGRQIYRAAAHPEWESVEEYARGRAVIHKQIDNDLFRELRRTFPMRRNGQGKAKS